MWICYRTQDTHKGLTRETVSGRTRKRGCSLECTDLPQLSNIEWLSIESGEKAPHSKGAALADSGLGSLERYLKGETKCQPTSP